MKKSYIEILRVIATLAVVLLHINMTLPANYTKTELGLFNYALFENMYMLVSWAVPVFFMISGALLLEPSKHIDLNKVKKYLGKMLVILFTFGSFYAFLEIFFYERSIKINYILRAVWNVVIGKSWDHLWYIYVLIGLYILLIPLKCIVDKLDTQLFEIFLMFLIVGCFVIPSINNYFNLTIKDCMLISDPVVYFMLGYYISMTKRDLRNISLIGIFISPIMLVVTTTLDVYGYGNGIAANAQTCNIFRLYFAVSIFYLIKRLFENRGGYLQSNMQTNH
jgi:surface polysaccharide O-acyltransferase-like enzyme